MKKITDPSKLLPAAKSAAVTRTKRASIKPSSALVVRPKKESALVRAPEKSTALVKKENKSVEYVNVRLIAIENLFRNDFANVKKEAEAKRKKEEEQDFAEAEKKLETPKSRKLKLGGGGDSPSLGFFDRLKRFLFFTTLGWLLPKIIDFLPKLEGTLKTIGTVYKFAEGLFGKLFDGFMTLVKFGGDLKKQTLGFIAGMKGGDYQTEFNKLEKTFDTFVNASIIAGVLAADIGFAAVDEYNKWRKKNKPARGKVEKPTKPSKEGREKVTQGRGGRAASGAASRVTQGKGGKTPGWWNKIFKGPFAKLKGPLSKFAGAAVPGLGAVVGAADSKARFAAGDSFGGTLAAASATLDAWTAATAILAFTGIGAAAPAAFGTISIGIDVFLLIRDILKAFNVPVFNKGGRVVNSYQGGGTARTTRRAPRQTTIKKPIKTKPPETKVGRDVGGEKKIMEFYAKDTKEKTPIFGNFAAALNFFSGGIKDKEQNKPLEALKRTSKILKDLPFGLGYFAGGAIDIALGQSMDVKRGLGQLSSSIAYMVDSLANQKANMSMTGLIRDLNAFAEGGTIPATRTLSSSYSSVSSGDLIAKVIGPTIEQKVNEAMQSIEKDLRSLQQKKEEPTPPGTAPGSSGFGLAGGEYGGYAPPGGLQKEIYDYLTKEKKLSDVQALGLMANINRESSFIPGNIEPGGGRGHGLMQWSYERTAAMIRAVPDWKTNWRGQLDYALNEPYNLSLVQPGEYQSTRFSSAQEAADWWMSRFLRPADKTSGSRKHAEYLRGIPRAPDGTAKFRAAEGPPSQEKALSLDRLIPHSGPGGFLQGSSGFGREDFPRYGVHFHLSPPNTSKDGLFRTRNVAFLAIKRMLSRGSSVYLPNIKRFVPANASDSQIQSLLSAEQRAHTAPGRTQGGIDIQEQNPNVGPTHRGLLGSKTAFPFAVGEVTPLSSGSGYGREAEILGSGGVVLAHGASGSAATDRKIIDAELAKRGRESRRAGERREYDVIIPLDHHTGRLPDKSLWPNASLGAAGREREAQNPTAELMRRRLEAKGLRVKILRPEDYRTEREYNAALMRFSKAGAVVTALHYDAPRGQGGVGFLARLGSSPDKADRDFANKLAPILRRMAAESRGDQIYGGIDTAGNITMSKSGPATAALIELGSLVEQEKRYGKNFWTNPEFIKHLDALANVTASSVQGGQASIQEKLAKKGGREGVIVNGVWRPKTWSSEERQRYGQNNPQENNAQRQFTTTRQLGDAIRNLKPGESVTVPGVGKVSRDRNGRVIYSVDGKGVVPGSKFLGAFDARNRGAQQPQRMQQGGIIRPRGSQLPIPNSYAPYETPAGSTTVLIQPYVIEKPSIASGNRTIAFPVPMALNNTNKNLESLSRG